MEFDGKDESIQPGSRLRPIDTSQGGTQSSWSVPHAVARTFPAARTGLPVRMPGNLLLGIAGVLALSAIAGVAFIESNWQARSVSIEEAMRMVLGQVSEYASHVQRGGPAPDEQVMALLSRGSPAGLLGARRAQSSHHARHIRCRALPVGYLLVASGDPTRPSLNCASTNPIL